MDRAAGWALAAIGAAVVAVAAYVAVVAMGVSETGPPEASWDAEQKAQVQSFAQRLAVVGDLVGVTFVDSPGGMGAKGAVATIRIEPSVGASSFAQTDFRRVDDAISSVGWHILADKCYDGDVPSELSCPIAEGASVLYSNAAIEIDINHGMDLPAD